MTRYVIAHEPPCRCGSEDCRTYDLDECADLPAMQPGDSVRVTMTDDGFYVVPVKRVLLFDGVRQSGRRMWRDAPEQENDR